MKKVLITLSLTGFAAGVFAQGTIQFANTGSGYKAPVYGPEPNAYFYGKTGNTTAGIPAGTQVYTGPLLAGSQYIVQLYAGNGTVTEANMLLAGPTATFRTGTAAGFIDSLTVSVAGIGIDAPIVTIQYRAWDNSSGYYPTWTQARSAWINGSIAAGMSPLLTGGPAGGGVNVAFQPVGLQSFNLGWTPEPTTMALVSMGAAALLIFRRRN